jgi:hypothetical protein
MLARMSLENRKLLQLIGQGCCLPMLVKLITGKKHNAELSLNSIKDLQN